MPRMFLRYSLAALAVFTMLLLPMPIAHAQKEQFVRSKPHVNVGSAQSTNTSQTFVGRNDGRVQQMQSSNTSKGLTTKKGSQPVRATPAVQIYRFSN